MHVMMGCRARGSARVDKGMRRACNKLIRFSAKVCLTAHGFGARFEGEQAHGAALRLPTQPWGSSVSPGHVPGDAYGELGDPCRD